MFCLTRSDKKSHVGGKKLQKTGTFFKYLPSFLGIEALATGRRALR